MNKKITGTLLAVIVMMVCACSEDDEKSPAAQFSFNDQVYKMKNAKIYLLEEDVLTNARIRSYFITDGTHTGGSGWIFEYYTGATYVLGVQLAVPKDETFDAGSYPLYANSYDLPADSTLGYVSFSNSEVKYDTPANTIHGNPVMISGSTEPDETITVTFDLTLKQYGGAAETGTAKAYFKGKVHDLRETAGRQAQR